MNPKRILMGIACCALIALPGFAQATGSASDADKKFVQDAAQTDMLEAHLGQMAQEMAAKQDVKDYAQTLTTDHTKNYDDLTAAATKAGVDVPKAIDAQGNKVVDMFAKLKGAAFDRRFETEMVAGHRKAIAEFKKEADSGQDPGIKDYASKTLPTLQDHLEKAEALAKPAKRTAGEKKGTM